MSKVIYLGNGPLAEYAKPVIERRHEIVFHARTKEDLAEVVRIKQENPEVYAVLASFGVMVKDEVLELFEPEGILNLHPSLLPKYRGASPIETAILEGENEFGWSVMKLVKEMDAGPIYQQEKVVGLELRKEKIYESLAAGGASWIAENLEKIREMTPKEQQGEPSYTVKFEKAMGELKPNEHNAEEIYRQIVAYQGFPKPKYEFYGKKCIILEAEIGEGELEIRCRDGRKVAVKRLQPEGKKPMDTKAFLNGYKK